MIDLLSNRTVMKILNPIRAGIRYLNEKLPIVESFLPDNFLKHSFAFFVLLCITFGFSIDILLGKVHLLSHDNLIQFFPSFVTKPALWDPALQLGYPAYADPQSHNLYLFSYLFPRTASGFQYFALLHVFLAAFWAYLLSHRITKSLIPSLTAGVIFGFSGSIVGQITMLPVAAATSWMPLVFLCFYNLSENPRQNAPISAGSLAIAACLTAGHPQIFVHTMLACGMLVLTFIVRNRRVQWSLIGKSVLTLFLGLLVAAVLLVPLSELLKYSARSGPLDISQLNQLQMPVEHLIRLVHPYAFGVPQAGPHSPMLYHSAPNFHELHRYLGLISFFLIPAGLIGLWKDQRRLSVLLGVSMLLFLLLSLGDQTPLSIFVTGIPGLNRSRGPARHFAQLTMLLSLVSAVGLKHLCNLQEVSARMKYSIGLALTFLFLLAAPFAVIQSNGELSRLYNGRTSVEIAGGGRFAVQVALLAIAFVLSIGLIYFRQRRYIVIITLLFCTVDIFHNQKYVDWGMNSGEGPIASGPDKEQLEIADRMQRDARYYFKLPVVENTGDSYLKGFLPYLFFRPNLTSISSRKTLGTYNPLALKDAGKILVSSWVKPEITSIYGIDYIGGIYRTIAKPDFSEHLLVGSCHSDPPGIARLIRYNQSARFLVPEPKRNSASNAVRIHARVVCRPDAAKYPSPTVSVFGRQLPVSVESDTVKRSCLNQIDVTGSSLPNNCLEIEYRNQPFERLTQIDVSPSSGLLLNIESISMQHAQEPKWHLSPRMILATERKDTVAFRNDDFIVRRVDSLGPYFLAPSVVAMEHSAILSLLMVGDLPDLPASYRDLYRRVYSGTTALVEPGEGKQREMLSLLKWNRAGGGSRGELKLARSSSTEMVFKSRTKEPSFLVLNQPFYPGWEASIGGKKAELFRTNFFVTGLIVPPGINTISLKFRPSSLWVGMALSLIGLFFSGSIGLRAFLRSSYRVRLTDMVRQAEVRKGAASSFWPFIKYGMVGLVSTGIHFLILVFLVEVFRFAPVVGTVPAFLVALLASYGFNSRYIFQKAFLNSGQFLRFAVVALFGLVLNVGLLFMFTQMLALWYTFAFVLVSGVVAVCTYCLNQFWTYGVRA